MAMAGLQYKQWFCSLLSMLKDNERSLLPSGSTAEENYAYAAFKWVKISLLNYN